MDKNAKKPSSGLQDEKAARTAARAEAKAARAAASAAKSAAKQAKANRGYVKAGPLAGLVLVIVGLAVFGIFFMNPLLERGAEAGLEAAFGARATVEGLRFRPFRMRLSVDSVAVADAASPMTDLFRTGRLELRLSPSAALRGKVYIEEASAATIELGVPRSTSGALPGAVEPTRVKPSPPEIPALVDWEAFDAKALLEREKAKLAAPAAYEAAGKAYTEAVERWKGRRETSYAAVERARASSKAALAIDVKTIRTAGEAAQALAVVKAAAGDVQSVGAEAKAVAEGIRRDAATLDRLAADARAAADRDAAYLKSLVTPGSGAARAALEPALRSLLTDKGETWLYYSGRFLEAAARLKASGGGAAGADKAGGKPAFRGRDVVFPGAAFPRFRLGLLASSFKAGDAAWYVEVREVSTEPDLVPAPSSLKIEIRRGGSLVRADARADLRESGGGTWEASLSAAHLPMDLGDALAGAGLSGFSGTLEGAAEVRGAGGSFSAVLDAEILDPAVARPSGTLGKAAADALRDAGAVNLRAEYRAVPGGKDSFVLRTDLDRIIAGAVDAAGRRYAAQASRELDAALRRYIDGELEGKLAPKKDFDSLSKGAEGDAASAASLEKSLDGKRAEIEARSKSLGADLLKGITVPKIGP
ncbi:MAG: hypothetical protein GX430_10080 [Treponema sp.]|nr:hypothetical protein [Treponema sp.]